MLARACSGCGASPERERARLALTETGDRKEWEKKGEWLVGKEEAEEENTAAGHREC